MSHYVLIGLSIFAATLAADALIFAAFALAYPSDPERRR